MEINVKCPLCGNVIHIEKVFIYDKQDLALEKAKIKYFAKCAKCCCSTELADTEQQAVDDYIKKEFRLDNNFIAFLYSHLDYSLTDKQKEKIKFLLTQKSESIQKDIERLNKNFILIQKCINTIEQYPNKNDMWIYALMATNK